MAFIDDWRAKLEDSYVEFAQVAVTNDEIDINGGILPTAILWPVRDKLDNDEDEAAYDALEDICGRKARVIDKAIRHWNDDPQAAARELADKSTVNEKLKKGLGNLTEYFDATSAFSQHLAPILAEQQGGGDTYNIAGQIKAALVNIGGVTNIQALNNHIQSLTINITQAAPAAPKLPPPPEPTHPPEIGHFVGREAELAYFADSLAARHVALIVGMAGMGKSALAVALAQVWQGWHTNLTPEGNKHQAEVLAETELTRQAQVEKRLFWHSFHQQEGVMPLIWKLAGFLAWNDQDELWSMLQTTQQSGGQPPPPANLFDYALQMLSGQNYLLCLDDLQWVEDDSLFIQFVKRLEPLLQAGEVSLIGTSRHVPLDYLGQVTFEPLAGLKQTDISRLLAAKGVKLPPTLVTKLYKHTEGNAELLTLTINVLHKADAPERIINRLAETDDIERYLIKEVDDGLSDDEREVLIAVAILLGYPGNRDAIETVAERRRLKKELRQLSDKQLLTSQEGKLDNEYKQQTILRDFYYDVPSRRERRQMHSRAAEYYHEEEPAPLRAAHHYELTGEYEQASSLATADVWGLINRGRAHPLRYLLERLLEQKMSAEAQLLLYLAHGQVCAFLSDNTLAGESYQAALSQLEQQPVSNETRLLKARSYRGLGESLRFEAPLEALKWLEQGLAELADLDNLTAAQRQEKGALFIDASTIHYDRGDYPATVQSLEQGLALLPPGPSQLRATALKNLGNVQDDLGQFEESQNTWQQGLEMTAQIHDHFLRLVITKNMGIGYATAGNWSGAMAKYQQAMELAEQMGSKFELMLIENSRGWLATNQGEYEAALGYFSRALDLTRQHHIKNRLPHVLGSLAVLLVRLKDWPAAAEILQEAEQVALETDNENALPEIYYCYAQVQLGLRHLSQAQTYAEQALQIATDLGHDFEQGIALGVLAQVKLAQGQTKESLTLFEQSVTHLQNRDPYQAARIKVVWGRHLISSPNIETGQRLLQEAQSTFQTLGAKRDLAEVNEMVVVT